jgi:hypothetical protein
MQSDPISEWQRLAAHYRELSDVELRELAADFTDLTESAQQALRIEMLSRGLGNALSGSIAASNAPEASNVPQAAPSTPIAAGHDYEAGAPMHEPTDSALGFLNRRPELVPDRPDPGADSDNSVEYTWKTLLCECDTSLQARELSEALKQAGIESWIASPGTGSRYAGFGFTSLRVLVAADQLDQARVIAAQPIPREIVKETETEVPDYQPPVCPKCGAADPVLEGVDPTNSWLCEQCGERWTDLASSEVWENA